MPRIIRGGPDGKETLKTLEGHLIRIQRYLMVADAGLAGICHNRRNPDNRNMRLWRPLILLAPIANLVIGSIKSASDA